MNKKIQILRAIAIIAVVLIHTNVTGIIGVINRPFLNFAVALFIFLSGYLTDININDWKKFYKKRILRVLIPYVIWSCIYTIAYNDFDSFIYKFLTANCCNIYYYIFVYIQFVLITPLIIKLIKSRYNWIGWLITPISIFIIRYICNFMNIKLGFPFPGTNFFVWFSYYYLGIMLGNKVLDYNLNYSKTVFLYIISIVIALIEGMVWYKLGDYDMATTQVRLTSIISSMVAMFISYLYIIDKNDVKDNKLTKLLIIVGDSSFGIYLSHILIMAILSQFSVYLCIPFPITSIIVVFVSTICVIIGKKVLGVKYSKLLGL